MALGPGLSRLWEPTYLEETSVSRAPEQWFMAHIAGHPNTGV